MSVKLITWNDSLVTPLDDALVYHTAIENSGIIYGATVSIKSSNLLHITSGHGILCGRKFTVEEEDIPVVLPATGDMNGRLYIHMDLSNTGEPIQLMTEIAQTLTPEIRDDDINIIIGTYDMNIVTFTASPTGITELERVAIMAGTAGKYALEMMAPIEDGDTLSRGYSNSQLVTHKNKLYFVLNQVAQGSNIETLINDQKIEERDISYIIYNVKTVLDFLNSRANNLQRILFDTSMLGAVNGVARKNIPKYQYFFNLTSQQSYAFIFGILGTDTTVELWKSLSTIDQGYSISGRAVRINGIDGLANEIEYYCTTLANTNLQLVKNDVDVLTETGSKTINIGIYQAGSASPIVRNYGKTGCLQLYPMQNLQVGSLVTIGMIPIGYRPKATFSDDIVDVNKNSFRIRLQTNGEIQVHAYDAASGNLTRALTYIIQ